MRILAFIGLMVVTAVSLAGGRKVLSPTTTGSNDLIDITATITLNEEEVTQKIGADPGKGVVLLEVRVSPKTEKAVDISPDDFILLAHDDGERSKPYEPAQLAGSGAMTIKTQKGSGSVGTQPNRPTVSGIGIPMGRSSKQKDDKDKEAKDKDAPDAKVDDTNKGNGTLLAQLKAKQLPAKETSDPVEGYLYFPLDGKHKLKNLAILYRGQSGRIDLEFEH